jgi:hypothetical protein
MRRCLLAIVGIGLYYYVAQRKPKVDPEAWCKQFWELAPKERAMIRRAIGAPDDNGYIYWVDGHTCRLGEER